MLDIYGPRDWALGINLETLDLWDNKQCVLGQLYGHYKRTPDHVFVHSRQSAFIPLFQARRMTKAWKFEIRLRCEIANRNRSLTFPPEWIGDKSRISSFAG